MKTNKYYAAAIAAFVIWGFIPFPLRALTPYPSGQILYFRLLLSVLILLLLVFTLKRKEAKTTWLFYRNSSLPEKRKMLLLTLAGGALLTINWLLFIYVINHISIQTASFSYLLCPILTAVLGFLILKEPLRKNQWAAISLSLLSCGLIGVASFTNLLFSLLIAASYAFYLISQRALTNHDKIVLLTAQLILGFIIIAPFYNYLREGAAVIPELQFFGPVLALSVVFTVLPLFLNLFALQELKSGTIGILMYLNPIINFLLAFLYFGEETTVQQGLAYALIFLSIILYNLQLGQKKAANLS
ncbi:EamA family transporter [Adhaeribacter sp. BT258]|uniref:EamA family transporter n=1 Tax=Adhaeribacter terrigena TaxID=2793070 RepID=A0ABS1C4Q8_9BACT|nr:EamA family transporter [Adhaeribacter terrigena]MBK0404371.1 EamA family transporter [Adhaeribacter terrigena]